MEEFDLGAMLGHTNPIKENVIKPITVDMLIPYHKHKFQLYSGERLDDMVESIRTNGVLTPIVVQPAENGKFEILIGHNRWNASKIAGKPTVPAIIKSGLSEDEAEMYVVESNAMQRGFDNLLISEQAAVIAMRHDKMFSEKKRKDIISELSVLEGKEPETDKEKKPRDTNRQIGEEYSMSRNSVARLIRINKLVDALKEAVDSGAVSVRAAVELSYIDENSQIQVSEFLDTVKIDIKKAVEIRSAADENGSVIRSEIVRIMTKNEKMPKPRHYKISSDRIGRFFKEDTSDSEIEDVVEKALELYFSGREEGKE